MGAFLSDVEAGWLRMLANRNLRFRREAEARGEKYNTVGGLTKVASGYRVRLKHEDAPQGYETVVEVWPKADGESMAIMDVVGLASEVLAKPAKLRGVETTDHLEFVADV